MPDLDPSDAWFTKVTLRRDLIAAGWNDRSIGRMVATGAWIRVRHGAYVEASKWRSLDAAGQHVLRSRAVLAQSRTELVVSHSSGVPVYEGPTWGLDLTSVHGTRTDGKCGRNEAGVRQHCGRIEEGDVVVRHGIKVMTATRLGLEVTTVTSAEAALAVVNHLLHQKHTTLESMRERYERGIYMWESTLHTDLVLRLANAAIESVGESRFFYLCYLAGLPAPIPQYEIRDKHGRFVARVDFAWPELGVFVEFDGKIKYQKLLKDGESVTDAVLREKRREELACEASGMRCIRFIWPDLDQFERTVTRLQDVLFGRKAVAS